MNMTETDKQPGIQEQCDLCQVGGGPRGQETQGALDSVSGGRRGLLGEATSQLRSEG